MAGTAPTTPKVNRYVVVSDAAVVTTGKKENGKAAYARVLRGGVINGPEESEQIQTLVRAGAIKQVKSKAELDEVQADLLDPLRSKHRQTVRRAAAAQGADDDPVAQPQEAFLPVPAPLPDTSPGAILADEE